MKFDNVRRFPSSSSTLARLGLLLVGALTMMAPPTSAFQLTSVNPSSSRQRRMIGHGSRSMLPFGIDSSTMLRSRMSSTVLHSSSSSNSGDENPTSSSAAVDDDEQPSDATSSSPPPPPEDPELVALKKDIADLESALKAQKRTLMNTKDSVEEYSKQGYARKVAEMENMRRARSNLNKNNRSYATAAVIAEFVPSYDQLVQLKSQYQAMEFAKQYDALAGTLRSAMNELGVQDFSVNVGDRINADSMNVLDKANSDEIASGCVLEVVNNHGLELQGNVVRKADVVASLGPVVAAEEEEEGGPAREEGAGPVGDE